MFVRIRNARVYIICVRIYNVHARTHATTEYVYIPYMISLRLTTYAHLHQQSKVLKTYGSIPLSANASLYFGKTIFINTITLTIRIIP